MKPKKTRPKKKSNLTSRNLVKKRPDIIYRYMWLIDIIYHSTEGITFEEINLQWMKNSISNSQALPLRTFHNYRKTIKELFGLEIYCNRKNSFKYKINQANKFGSVKNRLINLFMLNYYILENPLLEDRITIINNDDGQKWIKSIIDIISKDAIIQVMINNNVLLIKPDSLEQVDGKWYMSYYHKEELNNLLRIELSKIDHIEIKENW